MPLVKEVNRHIVKLILRRGKRDVREAQCWTEQTLPRKAWVRQSHFFKQIK